MKKYWWMIGLGLAIMVAVLSPLASSHPDGLERVAEDQGFQGSARDPWYEVIPDYVLPGIGNENVATVLARLIGTIVLFALLYGLGAVLRKSKQDSPRS